MPVVIALVAILAILGIANVSSLLRGNKKAFPASSLQMRPVSPNAQQVSSFETQQQLQAKHDAEERERQQQLMAAMQQLQATEGAPGPEYANAAPMTSAQRDTVYGGSPNAPQHTSNVSEAQAKAKQEALAREKQKQDAINSGTVAIDFEHSSGTPAVAAVASPAAETPQGKATTDVAGGAESVQPTTAQTKATAKTDPMGPYQFDQYQGQLYRVFEGTVLEGVVTLAEAIERADQEWVAMIPQIARQLAEEEA
jgi:type IV secretion system protein VirB10